MISPSDKMSARCNLLRYNNDAYQVQLPLILSLFVDACMTQQTSYRKLNTYIRLNFQLSAELLKICMTDIKKS